MVPLVNSPGYSITAFGFERRHAFDGSKYRRVHDWLIRQGLRRPGDFVVPPMATRSELLGIHTPEFLRSLGKSAVLAQALELPFLSRIPAWILGWRVLRPMRRATGGTILACRLALEQGLSINPGGGYHHANGTRAHGFCVYADVPLAIHLLMQGRCPARCRGRSG
jgi:histone deacetylase 11